MSSRVASRIWEAYLAQLKALYFDEEAAAEAERVLTEQRREVPF